jgi:uncharacterized protein (UPF0147 family)
MIEDQLKTIIEALNDVSNDASVPKNVKDKVEKAVGSLSSDEEVSIKVHKALNELDELADDTTMQPFTRTQIWNIVSALESV